MVRDIALRVVLKYVGIQEFARVATTCKSYANTMRFIVDDGKLFNAAIRNKDVIFGRAVRSKCNKIAILLLKSGVSQEARDKALQVAVQVHDQKMVRDILASGVSQEARDQALQVAVQVHDQKMVRVSQKIGRDVLASGVSQEARDQALITSVFNFEDIFIYLLDEGKVSQKAIDTAFNNLTQSARSIYPYMLQFGELLTKVTWGAYEKAFMKLAGYTEAGKWFDRIFAQSNDHLFDIAIKKGNLGAVRLLVVNSAEDNVRLMEKLNLLIKKWTMSCNKVAAVELMLQSFTPRLKPKQLNKILNRAMGNWKDIATIQALVNTKMLSLPDTIVAKKVLKGMYF